MQHVVIILPSTVESAFQSLNPRHEQLDLLKDEETERIVLDLFQKTFVG